MTSNPVTQQFKIYQQPHPSKKIKKKKITVFFNILSICNIFDWTQLNVSSVVLSMTKYTRGKKKENRNKKTSSSTTTKHHTCIKIY